jgi:hypothetical protein
MVRDMPIRPVIVAAMIFNGLLGPAKPVQCQCRSGPPGHNRPNGLSLVIKTQKSTIVRGEHLAIHVELSNKSKTSVIMRRWLVDEWNYWVRAVDTKGREVLLTDYGSKIRPPIISGSGDFIKLDPGQMDKGEQDASKIYDFSTPGKYTINVCRDLGDLGSIYSNRIEVRVMP